MVYALAIAVGILLVPLLLTLLLLGKPLDL
jgi:hypothetical protein